MLGFAVATMVYYAAYDLGYPNQWVPAVVAALTGVVAMRGATMSGGLRQPPPESAPDLPRWRLAALAAIVALAAAWLHGPWLVSSNRTGPPERVRLVAYNIRMGFGLDGRFDLTALERAVGRADVVVLSEVDRGWLLNGGHDTLGLLAARLGTPYVFAPAADPLWGTRCSAAGRCSGPGPVRCPRWARPPGHRRSASQSTSVPAYAWPW
ncbi:hypothetical protein GCM10029963_31040 [Micromonospora andamanensis]